MSLPSYGKLDKEANKLFDKGHVQGLLMFKSKTTMKEESSVKEAVEENVKSHLKFLHVETKKDGKPQQRVDFKTAVVHDLDTKELLGAFTLKYHFPQHGASITERWDTSNTLNSTVVLKELVPNLMLKLQNKFAPINKDSHSQMMAEYGNEKFKVNASVCPTDNKIQVSGVAFLNEWYLGALVKTDLMTDGEVNSAFCFGRRNKFYNFHCFVENQSNFGTSVFVKAHQNLQLGVRLGWQGPNSDFAIATKYKVHDKLALLAKVDIQSKLDVSAIHKISSDVKLILSAELQGTQNSINSSRFGAGLVYKPE